MCGISIFCCIFQENSMFCSPEVERPTHLSPTGRADSRFPLRPFPRQNNNPRRGKSCAVYLPKMFRKLLCLIWKV